MLSNNFIRFLLLGFLYYIFVVYTGISIPCVFRYFTGYLCPGCGITTLLLAVGEGDFAAAKEANIFLFYTLPFLLGSMALRQYYLSPRYVVYLDKIVYPLYLAALLCFGVYRNL